jgi:hypothetical protein
MATTVAVKTATFPLTIPERSSVPSDLLKDAHPVTIITINAKTITKKNSSYSSFHPLFLNKILT